MVIDQDVLEHLTQLAGKSPIPLAELSMEELASALGMTRMTLYRKAGTREQIVQALDALGIDARRQPNVHERVVAATAGLLQERPIAELTMEMIASEAECSLPALYARFGGRQGVLKAVIERHSPLLVIRDAIATKIDEESADLRHDVRVLYRTLFTHLEREWPVIRSFLAELLRDPGSEVGDAMRTWYVPQIRELLFPLIHKHMERGTMRRLPIAFVVQALAAPMGLHIASRGYIEQMGMELPDPEGTVELLTDMFCRAVGTDQA